MMKRLRRTLSFRSRSKYRANNNPANWENDSINIKHGGLSFPAKYLGSLEVQESRGTQVCSNAAHQMKMHPQTKKKRVTLWVTEDTLRVIDDVTKSLVVDQVIEKVSFCTPDPSDEKLFSYICRDGTTRRWMCYSFRGIKHTGERISHAVGCAFTACLQKKQQQNMKNDNFQSFLISSQIHVVHFYVPLGGSGPLGVARPLGCSGSLAGSGLQRNCPLSPVSRLLV
eukprot:gene13229-4049_t